MDLPLPGYLIFVFSYNLVLGSDYHLNNKIDIPLQVLFLYLLVIGELKI